MFWGIFYLIGLFISLIMILILAIDEHKKGNSISDLPAAFCMCILSWLTVIMFGIAYADTYKTIIKSWFKKD